MKKLTAVLALVALSATSCFMGTIEGSGNVVTEERAASGFDHIALSNMGKVVMKRGDSERVSVRADDNIIPHLLTEVRDGTLHIGTTPRGSAATMRPSEPMVFSVTFREVSGISVSGSGSVDAGHLESPFLEMSVSGSGGIIIGDLTGGQVRTAISGSGMVSVKGSADSQTIEVSGSGGYYARELVTRDARVSVSGSGMVTVNAAETLSAMISGSGTVTYLGDPKVTESVSGTGVLRPAD